MRGMPLLMVQVRTSGPTCGTGGTDALPSLHPLPRPHVDAGQVGVGMLPVPGEDLHPVPVIPGPSRERHMPSSSSDYWGSDWAGIIFAGMDTLNRQPNYRVCRRA